MSPVSRVDAKPRPAPIKLELAIPNRVETDPAPEPLALLRQATLQTAKAYLGGLIISREKSANSGTAPVVVTI
jgi:hypothetical protein